MYSDALGPDERPVLRPLWHICRASRWTSGRLNLVGDHKLRIYFPVKAMRRACGESGIWAALKNDSLPSYLALECLRVPKAGRSLLGKRPTGAPLGQESRESGIKGLLPIQSNGSINAAHGAAARAPPTLTGVTPALARSATRLLRPIS
jgi:hypothetical protein